MNKTVKIGAALLLILVAAIGALIYVFSSLDAIVKDGVESHGSEITGTTVSLRDVSIALTSGAGTLEGLRIGNPDGFDTESAFDLGGISLQIDTASIGTDTLVIKELRISNPAINYEVTGSKTNIDVIRSNVDRYLKRFDTGDNPEPSTDDGGEGLKLVVENLIITGATTTVTAPFLEGSSKTLTLADQHLKNLGKEEDGTSPAELLNTVLVSISGALQQSLSDVGLGGTADAVKQKASEALDEAKKKASGVGDTVKKLFGK